MRLFYWRVLKSRSRGCFWASGACFFRTSMCKGVPAAGSRAGGGVVSVCRRGYTWCQYMVALLFSASAVKVMPHFSYVSCVC